MTTNINNSMKMEIVKVKFMNKMCPIDGYIGDSTVPICPTCQGKLGAPFKMEGEKKIYFASYKFAAVVGSVSEHNKYKEECAVKGNLPLIYSFELFHNMDPATNHLIADKRVAYLPVGREVILTSKHQIEMRPKYSPSGHLTCEGYITLDKGDIHAIKFLPEKARTAPQHHATNTPHPHATTQPPKAKPVANNFSQASLPFAKTNSSVQPPSPPASVAQASYDMPEYAQYDEEFMNSLMNDVALGNEGEETDCIVSFNNLF
jgi:hypothetical protein